MLPPSSSIIPVFIGFHLTDQYPTRDVFLAGEGLRYLQRAAPIGCRDDSTRAKLEDAGVEAFVSGCLTLTFPQREYAPKGGKVFIVDAATLPIPAEIQDGAVFVSHDLPAQLGDEIKSTVAHKLLQVYRDEARLVVTTRLHCALPCVAMGIPVVFLGNPSDPRLDILTKIGVPIYRARPRETLSRFQRPRRLWMPHPYADVDWDPTAPNIDQFRTRLVGQLKEALGRAEDAAQEWVVADHEGQ